MKRRQPLLIITMIILVIAIGKNNKVHLSNTRGTVKSENGGKLGSFQNKQLNTDNLEPVRYTSASRVVPSQSGYDIPSSDIDSIEQSKLKEARFEPKLEIRSKNIESQTLKSAILSIFENNRVI